MHTSSHPSIVGVRRTRPSGQPVRESAAALFACIYIQHARVRICTFTHAWEYTVLSRRRRRLIVVAFCVLLIYDARVHRRQVRDDESGNTIRDRMGFIL